MYTTRKLLRGVLAALTAALTGTAFGINNQDWTGGGADTRFSTQANWQGGRPVSSTVAVRFDSQADKTVTFDDYPHEGSHRYVVNAYTWVGSTRATYIQPDGSVHPVVWTAEDDDYGVESTSTLVIADSNAQNGALTIERGTYSYADTANIGTKGSREQQVGGSRAYLKNAGAHLQFGKQFNVAINSAKSTFVMTGGTVDVASSSYWAADGSARAVADISGGTMTFAKSLNLGNNNGSGSSEITIRDTGRLDVLADDMDSNGGGFSLLAGSNVINVVDGGTLSARWIRFWKKGVAELNIDGGRLVALGNDLSGFENKFIDGGSNFKVTVGDMGGVVDLNGHDAVIDGTIMGTGTLVIMNSASSSNTLTFKSTPNCAVQIAGENVSISGTFSTFVIGEGQSYVYSKLPSAAGYEVYGTIDNTAEDLVMNGATINVREGGKVLNGTSEKFKWIRLQGDNSIINLYEGGEVQMTHLNIDSGTGHQFNFKGGTLTQLGADDGNNKYLFDNSDSLTITADEHDSVVDTQGYTAIIAKAVIDCDDETSGVLTLKGNGLNTITVSTTTAVEGKCLSTLKFEDIIAKLPVGIKAPLTFGTHGYASFDCSDVTNHTQTVRLSTGTITVPNDSVDYEHVLVRNDGSAGWEVTTDSEPKGLIIQPLGETLPKTDVWVGGYGTSWAPQSNVCNPRPNDIHNWTAGLPRTDATVIIPQGGDTYRFYCDPAFTCDTLKLPAVGEVRFYNQSNNDQTLRAHMITGEATLTIGGMALQPLDDYPLNVQVPVVVKQEDHYKGSGNWGTWDVWFKGTSAEKPLTFEKSFTVPSGVTTRFDNDYVLVKGDVTVDGSLTINYSNGDETISRTLAGSGTIKGSVTMASGATLATKGLTVSKTLTLNDNAVVLDEAITSETNYFKVASAATIEGTAHLATEIKGMTIKVMNGDVIFCDEDYGSEIEPVVPGTELNYNTPEEADAAAKAINTEPAKYIKLPTEMTETQAATYRSYLKAVASDTKVTFEFSPEGEAAVQDEVDESVKELDITGDDSTITTTPGLWYAILGGTDVNTITTPGTEVMATGTSTPLDKPGLGTTDAAFYKVRVSPTESKK